MSYLSKIIKFIIVFLLSFSNAFGQQQDFLREEAQLFRKKLIENHYAPPALDDKFSQNLFSHFIRLLDPNRIYFSLKDINILLVYENKLDDEFSGASWDFLPFITELYKKKLLLTKSFINNFLLAPINFSENEFFVFPDRDSFLLSDYKEETNKRLGKWLKFQLLRQATNHQIISEDGNFEISSEQFVKESNAREEVNIIENRKITRKLEHPSGFDNYVGSIFFNAFSSFFDPHSHYFSKAEWENFQDDLSIDGFSLGLDLEENNVGNILISRVIPGGPAWKSNELHKGDILLKLKWPGKSAIDLSVADIYEVENILAESNSQQLEIFVKRSSGKIDSVSLVKEKIRQDENVVQSFILKGKKKIGYISLPGFYTEWENISGIGCANDVAKEIVKLKKENIEGLILDIRFNGGGALIEGLNLAGIFIEEGPLFLIQKRGRETIVVKDMNRGTIYDGPLIVMINGESASASELVAATIQDYNRGLIVGSSSFGKATGQIILPLDDAESKNSSNPLSGFISVTIEKLYRVNGKSVQLNGVKPDIYLPDGYESFRQRESSLPFALSSDSVDKRVYFSPLETLPILEINQISKERVYTNKNFLNFLNLIKSLPRSDKDSMSLDPEYFYKTALRNLELFESFKSYNRDKTHQFKVENTIENNNIFKTDIYGKELNDLMAEGVSRDIYIEESFMIACDLINLKKK